MIIIKKYMHVKYYCASTVLHSATWKLTVHISSIIAKKESHQLLSSSRRYIYIYVCNFYLNEMVYFIEYVPLYLARSSSGQGYSTPQIKHNSLNIRFWAKECSHLRLCQFQCNDTKATF